MGANVQRGVLFRRDTRSSDHIHWHERSCRFRLKPTRLRPRCDRYVVDQIKKFAPSLALLYYNYAAEEKSGTAGKATAALIASKVGIPGMIKGREIRKAAREINRSR